MPFNMFPYSNLHNINADWLLKEVKDAAEDAAQAVQDAQEAAATVETYGTRLDTAEGDIDALELRMGTAEDDIDALKALNLGTRLTAAEGDIDNLETSVAAKANSSDVTAALAGKVDSHMGKADYLRVVKSQTGSDAINGAVLIINKPAGSDYHRLNIRAYEDGSVSAYSRIAIADPVKGEEAATKKYVDDQLAEYAEAPAWYQLVEEDGVWSLADNQGDPKDVEELITDIKDAKRVVIYVKDGNAYYNFDLIQWYEYGNYSYVTAMALQHNPTTGQYTRHDAVMISRYNNVSQQQERSYSVLSSDASPFPSASSSNLGMAYGVIRVGMNYKYGLMNVIQPPAEIALTGSTPTFTAQDNAIYTGGTLTSLTLDNYPATGEFTIVFESGSTPTTTSFPATILGLETFAAEADTLYEINIKDGRAVWHGWDVST